MGSSVGRIPPNGEFVGQFALEDFPALVRSGRIKPEDFTTIAVGTYEEFLQSGGAKWTTVANLIGDARPVGEPSRPARSARPPDFRKISLAVLGIAAVGLVIAGQDVALLWLGFTAAIVFVGLHKTNAQPTRISGGTPKGAVLIFLSVVGLTGFALFLLFGGLASAAQGFASFTIYLGSGFLVAWLLKRSGNGGCAAALLIWLGMILLLFSICGGGHN